MSKNSQKETMKRTKEIKMGKIGTNECTNEVADEIITVESSEDEVEYSELAENELKSQVQSETRVPKTIEKQITEIRERNTIAPTFGLDMPLIDNDCDTASKIKNNTKQTVKRSSCDVEKHPKKQCDNESAIAETIVEGNHKSMDVIIIDSSDDESKCLTSSVKVADIQVNINKSCVDIRECDAEKAAIDNDGVDKDLLTEATNESNNLDSDSKSGDLVINKSNKSSESNSEDDEDEEETKMSMETSENGHLQQNDQDSSTHLLRKFKNFPIFLVDYHHHVLKFIYRCVGSRFLPIEGSMLIHFDSHPDMVISRDILAKDTYDKNVMLEEASIESWIMPLCYTGIFTRIVWIKNSWCNQMPIGKHTFKIGEKDGNLFVDLPLSYFLGEGNYCDTKELSNARDIELFVIDAKELDAGGEPFKLPEGIDFFKSPDCTDDNKRIPFILDIDLDFFSVNNPFLSLYDKCNCYDKLSEIFAFDVSDIKECGAAIINQRRIDKLEALKSVFEYLEQNSSLGGYEQPKYLPELDGYSLELVEKLVESLKQHYPGQVINWLLVYDAGCTTDSGGLPHYNSTITELLEQYQRLKRFLQRLPYHPVAVTIARSAEDNYCPMEQVDDIQEDVMHHLDLGLEIEENRRTIYAYLGEKYNIMKL